MADPISGRPVPTGRSVRAVLALLGAVLGAVLVAVVGGGLGAPPAGALPAPPHGAWWYTELDLPQAWRLSQGAGVTVAVLDSGVQANVGDLRGQVLPGKDFTSEPGPATTDHGTPASPTFGHGTDMAAMIAGTGRGGGLIGVAPKAKILPVRVYAGAFADTPTAAGIRWAVNHGADIINMSFGGPNGCRPDEQRAVDYAVRHGVILVAATGDYPTPVGEPADCTGVLAVGAIADSQQFRAWKPESFGPQLDFVAPGDHLIAELTTGQLSTPTSAGTSQAAAIVSGTFALLRSAFPHASARDLVTRALYSVHNGLGAGAFGTRIDNRLGYGEILPAYALTHAPPTGAVNPIYSAIARHLAATGNPVARTGPAGDPTGTAAGHSTGSASRNTAPPAATSTAGGPGGGVIAGIAVAVLLVVGAIGALLARRRSSRAR